MREFENKELMPQIFQGIYISHRKSKIQVLSIQYGDITTKFGNTDGIVCVKQIGLGSAGKLKNY